MPTDCNVFEVTLCCTELFSGRAVGNCVLHCISSVFKLNPYGSVMCVCVSRAQESRKERTSALVCNSYF